jgi:5-methylcytosine-specific restriction endonuclease McrA
MHIKAIDICSKRPTTAYIKSAHSNGVTLFLSAFTKSPIPHPTYMPKLHLLNGGFGNDDKNTLEKAALGSHSVGSWVVPKSAEVGDDVVINIATRGLFAIGKIASETKPRTDWKNRYGAKLDSIELIHKPIQISDLLTMIPKLGWAKYPRSINTPTDELADQIRALISEDNASSNVQNQILDDEKIITNLRRAATKKIAKSTNRKQYLITVHSRNRDVRKFVLKRSKGICEGCLQPAPFSDIKGLPYLEVHHTVPRAEDGPDDIFTTIALCPNCHRRTDQSADATEFNDGLIEMLRKIEPRRRSS